jgi:hypothetical protein
LQEIVTRTEDELEPGSGLKAQKRFRKCGEPNGQNVRHAATTLLWVKMMTRVEICGSDEITSQ